jgi:rRNA metabolism SBDS family protein
MSKTIVVRYKKLELLCHPGSVVKYRKGSLARDSVLAADHIFKNAQKGQKANDIDIRRAFGSKALPECIDEMLTNGDFQLTAQERKELTEKKKNEIIHYFHTNYVNPMNKMPHPRARYEYAFKEHKINIDYSVSTERQVKDIYKKLVGVISMKPKEKDVIISIKKADKKVIKTINSYSKMVEVKSSDNRRAFRVSILGSQYEALLADLERCTDGDFQVTDG